MKIVRLNKLSCDEVNEIKKLHDICAKYDGIDCPVFLEEDVNDREDFLCFNLAYEGERLLSFLSVFIPGDGTAELYGFTSPELRNRGMMKKLLKPVLKELEDIGVVRVHYVSKKDVVKGNIKDTEGFFETCGLKLDHSEFALKYVGDVENKGKLVETNCDSKQNNAKDNENDDNGIKELENTTNDTLEIELFIKGNVVGGALAEITENTACIYDVYVEEEYRGKGFGTMLMKKLVFKLKNRGLQNIILQLHGDNIAAKALYLNHGFEIVEQVDYYS